MPAWLRHRYLDLHTKDELADLVLDHQASDKACDVHAQNKSHLLVLLMDCDKFRTELPAEIAASEPWPASKKAAAKTGRKKTPGAKVAKK